METPERLFLGLHPDEWVAVGTMVNAVVIIILAVFNFLYIRSASRQAAAAEKQAQASESQAAAALAQAKTASANLALLKVQIDEQSGQSRTRHIRTFEQIKDELQAWIPRLSGNWGNLPSSHSLKPSDWSDAVHWVERQFPDLRGAMQAMDEEIRKAVPVIENVMTTPESGRLAKSGSMGIAASHLREANKIANDILARISKDS